MVMKKEENSHFQYFDDSLYKAEQIIKFYTIIYVHRIYITTVNKSILVVEKYKMHKTKEEKVSI